MKPLVIEDIPFVLNEYLVHKNDHDILYDK